MSDTAEDARPVYDLKPPESRPPFRPGTSLPTPFPRPGPPRAGEGNHRPTDIAIVFMTIAAVLVLFPLLAREKPDHSPLDASRWNTVYYLVEHGTYEFKPDWTLPWHGGRGNPLEEYPEEVRNNAIQVGDEYYTVFDGRFWNIGPFWTIDMIKVGDKYYSSKPPFLATCVAGVVKAITRVTGWSFTDESPRPLMRLTVIIVQVVPFLLAVWLLALQVRRMTDSPFVRNFCIAAAALATYLTPYLLPLNNHVIAAATAMFALHAMLRIWYDDCYAWPWFAVAGFFGAFTFALELPAAGLLGLILLVVFVRNPVKAILIALPFALIPTAAYFYTTYLVTGELTPIQLRINETGGPYEYPGSYWHPNAYNPNGPGGIDALDEPEDVYLTHALVGHHGFFLLTPIFILSLVGVGRHLAGPNARRAVLLSVFLLAAGIAMGALWRVGRDSDYGVPESVMPYGYLVPVVLLFLMNLGMYARRTESGRPLMALLVLVVSAAVMGGYIYKTHNYGGVVQGFRWFFWLIPLWLLVLPAGVEMLARGRVGRLVCYALFAVSLYSAMYAMPQVNGETERPFSNSWAHEAFRDIRADGPLSYLRITY